MDDLLLVLIVLQKIEQKEPTPLFEIGFFLLFFSFFVQLFIPLVASKAKQ